MCVCVCVCVGAAVVPAGERGEVGICPGLDGCPQRRRKTENGREHLFVSLFVSLSLYLSLIIIHTAHMHNTIHAHMHNTIHTHTCTHNRWPGCSTMSLSLPFWTSVPVQ